MRTSLLSLQFLKLMILFTLCCCYTSHDQWLSKKRTRWHQLLKVWGKQYFRRWSIGTAEVQTVIFYLKTFETLYKIMFKNLWQNKKSASDTKLLSLENYHILFRKTTKIGCYKKGIFKICRLWKNTVNPQLLVDL